MSHATWFTAFVWAALATGALGDDSAVGRDEPAQAGFEHLVAELQKLGLMITADKQKIAAAVGEAPYFMFAERKEHQPRIEPLKLSPDENWLAGKPVFVPRAQKAQREKIYAGFRSLVQRMGYNEVSIYAADIHYGMNSYANFTLYKLGYHKDDPRRGKQPEVLLGDAQYVIDLP